MPFKVVQTIEKGGLKLTTVPETWEVNGTLFWPRNKALAEKLRKRENVVPDLASWTSIKSCVVKRSNLSTFEEGEAEIDAMSDNSDTETDAELPQIKKTSRTRNKLPISMTKSYNDMAQEQMKINDPGVPDYASISAAQVVIQEAKQEKTSEATNGIQSVDIDQQYLIVNQDQEPQIQHLQNDVNAMKLDLNAILQNQEFLSDILNNVLFKISEFQAQFEGYIKIASKKQQLQEISMTPIKNVSDIEDFERKIADDATREELFQKLHKVCSKKPGKGMSNAYYLVDVIFDRNFFNLCSWTGSSKGEANKVCFKAFSKTIKFFFDIVQDSDPSFTKADCEKFFKIVLKNSRSRCLSNQRMSSSKQKQSKKLKTSGLNQHVETDSQPSPSIQPLERHVVPPTQSSQANQLLASHILPAPLSTTANQPHGSVLPAQQSSQPNQSLQSFNLPAPLSTIANQPHGSVLSAQQSSQPNQSLQSFNLPAPLSTTANQPHGSVLPAQQFPQPDQSIVSHVVPAPRSTIANQPQRTVLPAQQFPQPDQLLGSHVVPAPRSTTANQPHGTVLPGQQSSQPNQSLEYFVVPAPRSTIANHSHGSVLPARQCPQPDQLLGSHVVPAPRSTTANQPAQQSSPPN